LNSMLEGVKINRRRVHRQSDALEVAIDRQCAAEFDSAARIRRTAAKPWRRLFRDRGNARSGQNSEQNSVRLMPCRD
jgi:hypothetical protein